MGDSLRSIFFARTNMHLRTIQGKLATIGFRRAGKLLGGPLLAAVTMESGIRLLPVPPHEGVTIVLNSVLRSRVRGRCWCVAASGKASEQRYPYPSLADPHDCLRCSGLTDNCRLASALPCRDTYPGRRYSKPASQHDRRD